MDFTSTTNCRVLVLRRQVARQHHADLVGEDFAARVVHHAAAVAVAVKAQARGRRPAPSPHRLMACSMCRSSGLGLYLGKVKSRSVSMPITSAPMRLRASGAKAPAVPLPQAAITLMGRDSLMALGHGRQIGLAHVGHGDIGAAGPFLAQPFQHDLLERVDLVRPEGQRPLRAHLHAGPAILIMAGGHHGDGGAVQRELREIGDRRQRQADVMHFAAGRASGR